MIRRLLLTSLALAATAHAAPPAPAAPVPVALVVDATDAETLGPRLCGAVRAVLDRDARVAIRQIDLGASLGPGPLAEADGAATKADRLFREMDLDAAQASIRDAIKGYEEHLPELAERDEGLMPLRDAQVVLSKIRFFDSDFDGAKDALRRAFALDPKLTYSVQRFPVQMKRVVIEARLLFDTLGAAKVHVSSEPAGAPVMVNGRATGVRTPASIEIAAGPNMIAAALPGYLPAHAMIDVGAAGQPAEPKLTLTLAHEEGPRARCREATGALAAGTAMPVDLDELARALAVDALVFVHVATPTPSRFRLTGAVFVRAPERPSSSRGAPKPVAHGVLDPRLERTGGVPALEGEAEALMASLDEKLREADHLTLATAEPSSGDWRWHRFRRAKAFWWVIGAVGVVVVGAAVGTGVGVGVVEANRRALARDAVLLGTAAGGR